MDIQEIASIAAPPIADIPAFAWSNWKTELLLLFSSFPLFHPLIRPARFWTASD
jgi:hypothetical protein